MNPYQLANAVMKVDGYHVPRADESAFDAFQRAKTETKLNLANELRQVDLLTFEQFQAGKHGAVKFGVNAEPELLAELSNVRALLENYASQAEASEEPCVIEALAKADAAIAKAEGQIPAKPEDFPTATEIARMSREVLASEYQRIVGYDPLADGEDEDVVRQMLADYITEATKEEQP